MVTTKRSPITENMKVAFGFIENYCNILENDTFTPLHRLEELYRTYCKAKGYSANTHKLRDVIKRLDVPYFKYISNGGNTAGAYYTAANFRIETIRTLTQEQEQRIYDLGTIAHSMGVLPFKVRPDTAYRDRTYFGYDAVITLDSVEYKGYTVDHLTLSIDGELILVCMNKQNGRVVRFRIDL
ncbi:hypothetical protein [Bacillus mycoides]|uniref:hypothetical protein n=1 Tax=Bacillus mycoides TaxID=1405 RepID=UPI0024ACA4C6|nr:hypothetical protein [Bacillus mycoides]MDI6535168.1 hypothetical protein [Bacillus mycoides]